MYDETRNIHPNAPQDIYTQIVEDIGDKGWSVTPDFASSALVAQLRNDIQTYLQTDAFHRAGVGQGKSFEVNQDIRNDQVKWLEHDLSPAQNDYLEMLEKLRLGLNRSLSLGLFSFECHLAVYPAGSFYKKHLDQFRDNNLRTITSILYLNHDWQAQDGGQLWLYHNKDDETLYEVIQPEAGKLVTFISERFPHEVRPTQRERMSITGWFRRRDTHAIL